MLLPQSRKTSDEIKKSHSLPKQYQEQIPENAKRKVGKHMSISGTSSAIKKFSLKYLKHSFIRTLHIFFI